MRVGAHESVAGGLHKVFARAQGDGCEAIQIFTRNQQRWTHKPLSDKEVAQFREAWAAAGHLPMMVHDSYLINLAATDAEKLQKSRAGFIAELERCGRLGLHRLVFHPGSHLGAGEEAGLVAVAASLDACIEAAEGAGDVRLLMETTAGQGTNLGWRLEHLRDILAATRYPERLGVCVDTAHVFESGYDWRDEAGYDAFMADVDRTVGTGRVDAFHLNDSKTALGSRVDRHARIGEGEIGLEAFRRLVQDERFAETPASLETPAYDDGTQSFADGIRALTSLR